jgi:hypothetical protein
VPFSARSQISHRAARLLHVGLEPAPYSREDGSSGPAALRLRELASGERVFGVGLGRETFDELDHFGTPGRCKLEKSLEQAKAFDRFA